MKKSEEANQVDLGTEFDTVGASNRGAWMELISPRTGMGTRVFFKLLGKHSTNWTEQVRERLNKRLVEEFKAQRGASKSADGRTAESIEKQATELLVNCTIGWKSPKGDVITLNGEDLEFTVQNCFRVYNDFPFIRDAVDEFVGEISNFMNP